MEDKEGKYEVGSMKKAYLAVRARCPAAVRDISRVHASP